MSKNIERVICAIAFGILNGLIYKYFGFEIAIITILTMIFIELFIKGDKENE